MNEQATTTASPIETTAPVEQVASTEVQTQVEQVESTPEVSTEPDYSFVPKKFLKDGKPDWENMAKSYSNLEKKIGSKGAQAPEDIAEYEWQSNGQFSYDEELSNSFKTDAQKAGLSKEQYGFVMSKYEELMTNTGFNPAASQALLHQSWGDEFNGNMKHAARAFEEFAPSDVNMDDPVFNNPTVLRLLARVGQEMGEDSQASVKGTASRSTGLSKADVHEIMKSPDYYNNREKQAQVEAWYAKNSR